MTTPNLNYFLNETHELAHADRKGGGGNPKFGPIDWEEKGRVIARSLVSARSVIEKLPDPTTKDRLFLMARPVDAVLKRSDDKKKHPTGAFAQKPSFSGADSLAFRRLGIDLVGVTGTGEALVHVPAHELSRLLATTSALEDEGPREQGRWATVERFDVVPPKLKFDSQWLESFANKNISVGCVVRMHALLSRREVESVTGAIVETAFRTGDEILRAGRDYAGRPWFLARLRRATIEAIAAGFPSVHALHRHLTTVVDAVGRAPQRMPRTPAVAPAPAPPRDISSLPTVAVVDHGIASGHAVLGPYIRSQYVGRNSASAPHYFHGAAVASRVIFGDVDSFASQGHQPPTSAARVRVLDVAVTDPVNTVPGGRHCIEDEDVIEVMLDVLNGNPDTRVFNLSFSGEPTSQYAEVERSIRLSHAQSLDNLIFAHDVIVVVSAGNSPTGALPSTPYPGHVGDSRWEMGPWAAGVNTLKCGAYVSRPIPEGVVRNAGWPSPFTRIGPPVSGASSPEFSAPGGDFGATYRELSHGGVWCCDEAGNWVDYPGTSFAAPVLAREAALFLDFLQRVAGRPYAVLARALMTVSARRPNEETYLKNKAVVGLAGRTLGRGRPSLAAVATPSADRALVMWQGKLASAGDIARVQVPIPQAWLSSASAPVIRLVVCWDPPVNHAVVDIWSCRSLTAKLKPSASAQALKASTNPSRGNSPVIDRTYDLSKARLQADNVQPTDDSWIVELSYEDAAVPPQGNRFDPQQRVGFVAELFDEGTGGGAPHSEIQKLKAFETMTRLSAASLQVPSNLVVTVK